MTFHWDFEKLSKWAKDFLKNREDQGMLLNEMEAKLLAKDIEWFFKVHPNAEIVELYTRTGHSTGSIGLREVREEDIKFRHEHITFERLNSEKNKSDAGERLRAQ